MNKNRKYNPVIKQYCTIIIKKIKQTSNKINKYYYNILKKNKNKVKII